ncbi:MAG: phage minor head protein [Sulfurimicrobium sp.]|nr:phage minor head protein [Gallionella sp.]MDP1898283.1 phage minor head protein [Sulfurimicrobium sp.]
MPDPVDLSAVFGLPPEQAIEYFKAKGYAITWDWRELWQEAHANAFTVAKVMNTDILNDIRGALDDALNDGTTLRDFQKSLTPVLQAKGWWGKTEHVNTLTGEVSTAQLGSPRRLKTIYQTNLQTAYMAGRYKRMMENVGTHPYWQYVAVMDGRTRPTHRAMNGRVFRYDDPAWGALYPPNGFNCRCRVSAISEFEAQRDDIHVESSDERLIDHNITLKDGSTVPGKALRIKVDGQDKLFAPDAGWSYNPGRAAFGTDIEVMRKISAVKDRAVRVQAVQAINNSELRHQVFASWVSTALTKRAPGHEAQVVGFVSEEIADFAKGHNGGVDAARVLALPEKRLLHADSFKHKDGNIALTPTEYQSLPAIVAKPNAVYWDTQERDIVYTYPAEDGRVIYVPARLDFSVKKLGKMDVLVNAYKVEAKRFNSDRYIKMGAP